MRTTEPIRWSALEAQVAAITPETLQKWRDQKSGVIFGRVISLEGDVKLKDRFCTVQGLNEQLDDFTMRVGLVYYIDEASMSMQKTGFEKTREEHYG